MNAPRDSALILPLEAYNALGQRQFMTMELGPRSLQGNLRHGIGNGGLSNALLASPCNDADGASHTCVDGICVSATASYSVPGVMASSNK